MNAHQVRIDSDTHVIVSLKERVNVQNGPRAICGARATRENAQVLSSHDALESLTCDVCYAAIFALLKVIKTDYGFHDHDCQAVSCQRAYY